jgi:hypothetical protein
MKALYSGHYNVLKEMYLESIFLHKIISETYEYKELNKLKNH